MGAIHEKIEVKNLVTLDSFSTDLFAVIVQRNDIPRRNLNSVLFLHYGVKIKK